MASSPDEQQLLARVRDGDEAAFKQLFDRYRDRLYFFTLKLTGSEEAAKDILQDTFLRIWLRRDRMGEVEQFSAYVFRMARNNVLTGMKRKALETAILHDQANGEAHTLPAETLEYKFVRDEINKAIHALPEQQQRVFILRREEGRRIKEIAQMLGLSEVTVKRHLSLAQQTLREHLEQHFPGHATVLLIIFELFLARH